jgi:hypothetical protein
VIEEAGKTCNIVPALRRAGTPLSLVVIRRGTLQRLTQTIFYENAQANQRRNEALDTQVPSYRR